MSPLKDPPQGFVLVPVEPTPEMAKVGCYRYCAALVRDYKAMLAAAPKLPAAAQPADTRPHCYQCLKPVNYLFSDSRCADCTRVDPEQA